MTQKLNVIMPVFNEVKTVKNTIDKVLSKIIEGIEIHLIIVESNSTDGTKELIKSYESSPNITVIFQEKARGKGFAVRDGLKIANGDFILIQDADDEYDIEDYDKLLEPLIRNESFFVLGSRHSEGSWGMREFADQPFRAWLLNCGHCFFTFLINTFYGVHLKDPFTMYKVFKRECILNMEFVCDKFDFDHELVIKLIRRGYVPLEIPIKYTSRSFAEGKKIRIFSDPLTWIYAILRFKFSKLP
jgi:glycosyltransferase involved in cell wall biosynthesis